jgi:hypothetical protein
MSWGTVVYAILLKNGAVYVGKSGELTYRLLGHQKKKDLADECVLWLKRNTDHDPFYEMKMTMHCMEVFGIENVQGSIWASKDTCALTQRKVIYCTNMLEETSNLTAEQQLSQVKVDYEAAKADAGADKFTKDITEKVYCDGYDLCYGTLESLKSCSCSRHAW